MIAFIRYNTTKVNLFSCADFIDFEQGTIDMYFASATIALPKDTVVFEFWFAAPANSISQPFMTLEHRFAASSTGNGVFGSRFLLGDMGGIGEITSSALFWVDFVMQQTDGYAAAVDVNRDHVVNLDDKVRLQQYLSGEIKSLF